MSATVLPSVIAFTTIACVAGLSYFCKAAMRARSAVMPLSYSLCAGGVAVAVTGGVVVAAGGVVVAGGVEVDSGGVVVAAGVVTAGLVSIGFSFVCVSAVAVNAGTLRNLDRSKMVPLNMTFFSPTAAAALTTPRTSSAKPFSTASCALIHVSAFMSARIASRSLPVR